MAKEVAERTDAPMTWSASGRSILKPNIRLLWLCGAWPLPGSWLFEAYSATGLLLGLWHAAESAAALYYCWGDLEETTLVLVTSLSIGCGTVKMALFRRQRRRYCALARGVDALVSLHGGFPAARPAWADIQRRALRLGRRLTLGTLLFRLSLAVVWFPMPAIAQPGARRLPLNQHAWDNNSRHYELTYAAQCVVLTWTTQFSNSVDLLFVTVMLLTAAQLRILTLRLSSLKPEDNEEKLEKVSTSVDWESESTCNDEMYQKLCLCIEDHQKILRFARQLEKTMSSIVMTQFGFSVLITCASLFKSTYVVFHFLLQSTDFGSVLKCAGVLPIPVGLIYVYCWAAHSITEQAGALSLAAYNCSWLTASPRFKRALRILINGTQRPLVLTAGHLYPMNRQTFVSLVNASYSYYALLGQINKRKKNIYPEAYL